jgi:outer membrane protein TolC
MQELTAIGLSAEAVFLALLTSCAGTNTGEPSPPPAELARIAWPAQERTTAAAPWDAHAAAGVERTPGEWTLDAVLAEIAAANPTLARAEAGLALARERLAEARAATWPELTLGTGVVSTDEPAAAFAFLLDLEQLDLGPGFDPTPDSVETWRSEARLDWAILAPGRREARHAAEAGELAAAHAREAVEQRLANAGVQAWLSLAAARALEEVARESVDVVAARLQQTRVREAEGAALRADVLRLEARHAGARRQAASAAYAARAAESALNHLMGRAPGVPIALAAEELEIGADLPGDLDGLDALARERRPDLLSAAHRARAMEHEIERAGAADRPVLAAFAGLQADSEDIGFDSDLVSSTLGIGLRWTLSASTNPRERAARAQARAAREELRELAHAAAREVRDAHDSLAVARETRELAEAEWRAAAEAFRLVAEAQDAGAATATDVLEAEDARRTARGHETAARYGVLLARARLVAATGGVR